MLLLVRGAPSALGAMSCGLCTLPFSVSFRFHVVFHVYVHLVNQLRLFDSCFGGGLDYKNYKTRHA